jgi:hypothetical protein
MERECYACGSVTSSNNNWYHNRDVDRNVFCQKCNDKYIKRPKWQKIHNDRYNPKWSVLNRGKNISYKGKHISLRFKPRTGICKKCGKQGFTHLHHFAEYHDDDPLKDTVELCRKCHTLETWDRGQYNTPAYQNRPKPIIVRNEKGQIVRTLPHTKA